MTDTQIDVNTEAIGLRSADTVLVPVDRLRCGLSPRAIPPNQNHIASLIEVIDRLPPILVHENTMMVIDGVHRLEAFRRSGKATIPAKLFRGGRQEAFVLAVAANVAHGLPLTVAERKQAAKTLLRDFPDRSDRWLARICGVSAPTVAKLRTKSDAATGPNGDVRVGIDGRRRRLDGTRRRHGTAAGVEDVRADMTADIAQPSTAALPRGQRAVMAPSEGNQGGMSHESANAPPANPLQEFPELVDIAAPLLCTAGPAPDKLTDIRHLPDFRLRSIASECKRQAVAWQRFADMIEGLQGR
jgi:ParB-like chromosome segregation protein Spo0J